MTDDELRDRFALAIAGGDISGSGGIPTFGTAGSDVWTDAVYRLADDLVRARSRLMERKLRESST